MNRKIVFLVTVLLLVVIAVSCKKKDDDESNKSITGPISEDFTNYIKIIKK